MRQEDKALFFVQFIGDNRTRSFVGRFHSNGSNEASRMAEKEESTECNRIERLETTLKPLREGTDNGR